MRHLVRLLRDWLVGTVRIFRIGSFVLSLPWSRLFPKSIVSLSTSTSKKKMNITKKSIFCHSFQKVKPIYYIDSLHIVKYFKPLFLEMLMIMAYRLWKPKIQSLRKFENFIRSIKKGILNRNVRLLKSMLIYIFCHIHNYTVKHVDRLVSNNFWSLLFGLCSV